MKVCGMRSAVRYRVDSFQVHVIVVLLTEPDQLIIGS